MAILLSRKGGGAGGGGAPSGPAGGDLSGTYPDPDIASNVVGANEINGADAAAIRVELDVPSNSEAILDTIVDAKGDLIVGTAADTPARLAVGATKGHALLVDASTSEGVEWGPPIVKHTYATGRYYTTVGDVDGDTTFVMVKDQVYYTPFPVWGDITIDRIASGVSGAGGASSVVRFGIYSTNASGYPGSLVLDAGTIDGTSATYQEITVSQALSANTLYWMAAVWQVGTAGTIRGFGIGNGSEWFSLDTNARDPRTCAYTETGITGALPATATPSTGTGVTSTTRILVRIA